MNIGVQNCEVSEHLSFLKAAKLVSQSFTDAGRRQKTPESETENCVNHSTAGSVSFVFVLVPLAPTLYSRDSNECR